MARNLVRFDPFVGLDAIRRDFFDDGLVPVVRGQLPTTDVYTEDDKQLVVESHLPNFSEKDISVTLDHGALVVQAERREKDETDDKNKKYVVRESSTSFYRSIPLPEQADEAHISADFTDGVLRVTVPLAQEERPRSIQVQSGSEAKQVGGEKAAKSEKAQKAEKKAGSAKK